MSKTEHSTADAVASLVIALPVTLWAAWVEKTLWWWFAVPLGLPAIGTAHAYGISCLLVCLSGRNSIYGRKADDRSPSLLALGSAAAFGVVLLSGWIAHRFMGS